MKVASLPCRLCWKFDWCAASYDEKDKTTFLTGDMLGHATCCACTTGRIHPLVPLGGDIHARPGYVMRWGGCKVGTSGEFDRILRLQ